jgi:amino acid transporter
VGINVVAFLNQVSVWWHVVFVVLIAAALFVLGTKDTTVDAGLTLFAIQPQDTLGGWDITIPPGSESPLIQLTFGAANSYPVVLAFFFSLLLANWTYTGYDASAHVAEETVGARVASAWGLFLSVAVSAVVGFIFLLALVLHLPDLSPLFGQLDDPDLYSQYYFGNNAAVIFILKENLGEGLGGIFAGAIAIAMSFCGLSSVASAGRMLYAFSRDDGIPGSGWLKKVSHRYRTPANALAAMVVVAFLFAVLAGIVGGGTAIVIVTAISTIFLYAAYGIVIYLGATTSEWQEHRVWSLGRFSKPIAWIAIGWVLVLMVLFSWPTSGNISISFMIGALVLLLTYYFVAGKRSFKGPQAMGDSAELTEIEREFAAAAKEVAA